MCRHAEIPLVAGSRLGFYTMAFGERHLACYSEPRGLREVQMVTYKRSSLLLEANELGIFNETRRGPGLDHFWATVSKAICWP